MVQSPSWEANWFAASQEIPRILRNPKVHYRTHKRPPPISILGQPNPVHIPTSYLLEIHPNITGNCCYSFLSFYHKHHKAPGISGYPADKYASEDAAAARR